MSADVDLDFGDRTEILSCIEYTPATLQDGRKHPSGIYVTAVPQHPFTQQCSLDYKAAEEAGYFKLDILNNSLYKQIKSPEHLQSLLDRPISWVRLQETAFVEKLVHIGNYAQSIQRLPQPISSIEELSMFLAVIRPGKKHLQGLPWNQIANSVWDREGADGYTFRKAHGIAYALLVTLNMALLEEQENA